MYYYNTKTRVINHKHYCMYCGRELSPDKDYDDRYIEEFYACRSCEGGQTEIQATQLIEDATRQAHKLLESQRLRDMLSYTKGLLDQIEYEHESLKLKRRFGVSK